jgi:hypothetical protein
MAESGDNPPDDLLLGRSSGGGGFEGDPSSPGSIISEEGSASIPLHQISGLSGGSGPLPPAAAASGASGASAASVLGPLPWPTPDRVHAIARTWQAARGGGGGGGVADPIKIGRRLGGGSPVQQQQQQQQQYGEGAEFGAGGDVEMSSLVSRTLSGTQLTSRRFAMARLPGAAAPWRGVRGSSGGAGGGGPGTAGRSVVDEAGAVPHHNVAVRALHLGTYVFKGSDALEMVSVTTTALAARAPLLPREEVKGKGRKVEERSGVADGAVASLPDVLTGLRDSFLEAAGAQAAAAVAAARADGGGGGSAAQAGKGVAGGGEAAAAAAAAGYAAWLAQEMGRRRMFVGDGATPMMGSGQMRMRSFTAMQRPYAPR